MDGVRVTYAVAAILACVCVAPLGLAVSGCGEMFKGDAAIARDTFATAFVCPKTQVAINGDGYAIPVEAAGCGHSAQYDCHGDASVNAIVCNPVQQLAKSAASTAWSCPEDRISIESNPTPAPQPPADVAADPARR